MVKNVDNIMEIFAADQYVSAHSILQGLRNSHKTVYKD